MKKIIDIYKECKIMGNLVQHQMRTAAVAMQVCESFDGNIDKENIIKACLLHDMGNIIKFNLTKFPEWNNPEGGDYWETVKKEYISKYGNNEHHASLEIAKEIGLSDRIIDLIECVDSSSVENIKIGSDFGEKICIYADNRVSPHGIVSTEERSIEAKERYKDHSHTFNEEKRIFFSENINEIEKQIFSHTKIQPEDINDDSIKEYLEKLENIEI